MDRKAIVIIALGFILVLFWNHYYTGEMAKYAAKEKAAAEEKAALEKALHPEGTPGAGAPAAATPAAPATEQEPEVKREIATAEVEYTFTSHGAGIEHVLLPKHLAEHDAKVELNRFGPMAIGATSEKPGEGFTASYQVAPNAPTGTVVFERNDARQFRIRKTYTLPKPGDPDEYVAHLDIAFENTGAQPVAIPTQYLYTGSAAALHLRDRPDYTGFGYLQKGDKFSFKNSSSGFSSGGLLGFGRTDTPYIEESGETEWACVASQYFATILTAANPESKATGIWTHRFSIDSTQLAGTAPITAPATPAPNNSSLYAVEGALTLAGFSLEPNKPRTFSYDLYTGPRELNRLKSLGQGQEASLDFGRLSIVSKTLLASMNWLHSKFGSYAAAIIVLTLIIRGLMWTLQNKATQSMKKMQALQPEMNRLKEKYQDDPQRMNQELMKLYKTYNVNPVAGCLPMVIQIPVFFGFYNMLGRAVELRNAHFLWVHDLSQPDTVATIAGFPINVLPICMAVTMLGQMSLSPKSGDAVQQRMMMFMPLIFIAFCYNYASGLALYFTVSNLFSIVQLYVTRNQTTPALQKAPVPGKKNRS